MVRPRLTRGIPSATHRSTVFSQTWKWSATWRFVFHGSRPLAGNAMRRPTSGELDPMVLASRGLRLELRDQIIQLPMRPHAKCFREGEMRLAQRRSDPTLLLQLVLFLGREPKEVRRGP